MTYYDGSSYDTTGPDASGSSPYSPRVSILPSASDGQPYYSQLIGAGGPGGGADPQTLAGHVRASQAISDVLMPTIAAALNADPTNLSKDRLYGYGADALRRIYGGGTLNDLQRGHLAKSAVDFFAGIPDDADGTTIQSKLGRLAANHITTHGALQQWAAGQAAKAPDNGASVTADDGGASNGAGAVDGQTPSPTNPSSGLSSAPPSGSLTDSSTNSSSDSSGSGDPGVLAVSGAGFQQQPLSWRQNPLLYRGTDLISPPTSGDTTGSNALITPTSGPPRRPGELISSKTPAPDWKARAKTAQSWAGDVGDVIGAATDPDPRGPAAQNVYEDATGYWRGTAVNRRTGKPVADLLVNDKFASIIPRLPDDARKGGCARLEIGFAFGA